MDRREMITGHPLKMWVVFCFRSEGNLVEQKSYIDTDAKTILCTLEGEFDFAASISLAHDLRSQAQQLGFNVFYDARKLSLGGSILPAYKFAEKLSSTFKNPKHRIIKVAFLCEANNSKGNWDFYEVTANNRGIMTKVFLVKKEAMEWLNS
jgi:hypothetical protein